MPDLTIDPQQDLKTALDLKWPKTPAGGYPEDIPEQMRNVYRGSRALAALAAYVPAPEHHSEPLEQHIRDLLSDLMHLADTFRPSEDGEVIDFDYLLGRGEQMHDSERAQP